jgi:hypothetical protein
MRKRRMAVAAVAVVLVGCARAGSDDTEAARPSPSPSPEVSPSPAGSSPSPTEEQMAGAEGAVEVLEQGGRYWAVYIVVAEPGSAELDQAFERIQDLGVPVAGFGELACDRGAAEALDVPPRQHGVGVYFRSRTDAEAFAATLDPPPVGVASVRTFCPD